MNDCGYAAITPGICCCSFYLWLPNIIVIALTARVVAVAARIAITDILAVACASITAVSVASSNDDAAFLTP